jgi:hypothetical protein
MRDWRAQFLRWALALLPARARGEPQPGCRAGVGWGQRSAPFGSAAAPGYHVADVVVDGVSQGALTRLPGEADARGAGNREVGERGKAARPPLAGEGTMGQHCDEGAVPVKQTWGRRRSG